MKGNTELLRVTDADLDLPLWGDNREPTPQRKLFAKFYTTKGSTFSNATQSYAAAFDLDIEPKWDEEKQEFVREGQIASNYNNAKVNGCKLLTSPAVRTMVNNYLMEQLNDVTADSRLNEILIGGKDSDSINAIKVYNELKGRVTRKVDVSVAARPYSGLTDEELKQMAE